MTDEERDEEIRVAGYMRDFAKLTRGLHRRQRAALPDLTIEIMKMWLHDAENDLYDGSTNDRMKEAIRAILEQHRAFNHGELLLVNSGFELRAIRAFVERVEKRPLSAAADFQDGVYDELAAMEKESNAGTNDR